MQLLKDLFRKKTIGGICLVILILFLLVAIFADVIAPTPMVDGNLPMDKMKLYSVSALLFFIMAGLFGIGGYLLDGMFNPGALGVGVFVGLMAAAMFYSHFSSKLRTVHFQHGAKDYYREGSMNLHVKTDEFLYKRTETRHIDRD